MNSYQVTFLGACILAASEKRSLRQAARDAEQLMNLVSKGPEEAQGSMRRLSVILEKGQTQADGMDALRKEARSFAGVPVPLPPAHYPYGVKARQVGPFTVLQGWDPLRERHCTHIICGVGNSDDNA